MARTKQDILIVEHDDPTREMYARALSRDYHVFAYADDVGVLELLCRHTIRAVVLEPSLPGGRGWALLASLAPQQLQYRVPVILCSTVDERKRGMALGAAAYLIKPVLPTTLLELLRRIVG